MIVDMDDVHTCLDTLESGEEFVFVFKNDGFRPYAKNEDFDEELLVILTPEWYDLTYCSNDWDDINLKSELEGFHKIMKQLNDEFISSKFMVIWK